MVKANRIRERNTAATSHTSANDGLNITNQNRNTTKDIDRRNRKSSRSIIIRSFPFPNPTTFLFILLCIGMNRNMYAASSFFTPPSPRNRDILRRVARQTASASSSSSLAFSGASRTTFEETTTTSTTTKVPFRQHACHGFRSVCTSRLSLLKNDNLMMHQSIDKRKILDMTHEIYRFSRSMSSIRLKSTSTSTTTTTTALNSKSCPDIDDEILTLDESPRFLDDNPSNPAAYQIPPFQDGDDFLVNIPKGQRIVSFGDVHGDILALYKFLEASQLLHPDSTITNPIWDGGNAILVQCGDILDRGAEELFCLRYLASLARQAPKHGGRVILLHGNHEALNANGLFQYADPLGNEEIEVVLGKHMDECKSEGSPSWRLQYAGNQPTRWAAFEPNGWLAKPLYKNMSVAAVVGNTVFVHAGLTKDHLVKYGGIVGMNKECREWFTTDYPDELKNDDGLKFKTVQEVINNANLRARTASKTMPECLGGGIGASSPVWMRDYSSPSNAVPKDPMKAQRMIDDCFEELGNGVQRMVMGHTPQRHINAALKGKAWRVDVGASKGVAGGVPEVLEIIHEGGPNGEDVINILTVDGKRIPGAERQVIEIPFF